MELRQSFVVILAAVVVLSGAATMPVGGADVETQAPELTIEATTVETNAPVRGMVEGEQPIQLHLEYSGLGPGEHEMTLVEIDVLDDEVREFTVSGDSGSRTFTLSAAELAETNNELTEPTADLEVHWGDERSNRLVLYWLGTTVYTDGYGEIPDVVEPGEEITIEYYGWTARTQQTHINLFRDDGALSDEQIRRTTVSGSGYYEGAFSITPSDYLADESDNEIEVQARVEEGLLTQVVHTDLVRSIAVAEKPTVIDARIVSFSPESGEYHTGDEITSQVEVENTGNTQHTFFVGYGVIDEAGTPYDNGGTTGQQVELEPGETRSLTVSWTVEEGAPTESYTAATAIWHESDRDNLETRLDSVERPDAFEVVSDSGSSTAQRTIADTTLAPGESTTVTVDVELDSESDPFISETFDPAFADITIDDAGGADLSGIEDANNELFASYSGVTEATLVYSVTVPEDAADGDTFRFDGEATTEDSADIDGDDTISVGISSIATYADENGIVDTDGLRTAINDWREGEIDTDLLREVITAWRSGDSVT